MQIRFEEDFSSCQTFLQRAGSLLQKAEGEEKDNIQFFQVIQYPIILFDPLETHRPRSRLLWMGFHTRVSTFLSTTWRESRWGKGGVEKKGSRGKKK